MIAWRESFRVVLVTILGSVALGGAGCSTSSAAAPPLPPDAASDAASDSGLACPPGSVAGFKPTRVAPVVHRVCTEAQIVGLVTMCLDPSLPANAASCQTWLASSSNQACLNGCPVESMYAVTAVTPGVSPPPAPTPPWGPLVTIANPGLSEFINVGACVSLSDPAHGSCGDAITASIECEYYVCAPACPVPDSSDPDAVNAALVAYKACSDAADMGPCEAYANAANACQQAIPDASAASFCLDGSLASADSATFDAALERLIAQECAMVSPDAAGGGG